MNINNFKMFKCLCGFFRKLCCGCCRYEPLNEIDEDTRLLPTTKPKDIFEKTEILFYGHIPPLILSQPFDVGSLGTFSKYTIKKIVFGINHCLIQFKNAKNELAVFGSNELGQLGLEIKRQEDNFYSQVTLNKFELENTRGFEIIDIAASENYSLILVKFNDESKHSKCNYIYKFGYNEERKLLESNLVKAKAINREEFKYSTGSIIKQIYSVENRDVLVTVDNSIYVRGSDFTLEVLKKYKILVDEFDENIEYLCLGKNSLLIYTEKKNLFGIGDNEYGELAGTSSRVDPIELDFFDKLGVKKVCAGARHTLVLTNKNKVYAFGDNSEAQCSGFNASCSTPTKVKFQGKPKIIDIYAGYNYSIAVSSKGEVFTWGDASSGKLGYNTGLSTQTIPKQIPFLNCRHIELICTGYMHMAIVTSIFEQSLINIYKTIDNVVI